MSGCPGDGPGATTVNWIWYPWPPDAVALLERQWDAAIPFWREMAAVRRRARGPADRLRAASAVPRLQRPDAGADAVGDRPDHRRQRGPVAHVLAADGSDRRRPGAGTRGAPRPSQGHRAGPGHRGDRRRAGLSIRSRIPPGAPGGSGRSGVAMGPRSGPHSSPRSARSATTTSCRSRTRTSGNPPTRASAKLPRSCVR